MDYIISVKVKNQAWYDAAEQFGGVKEFESWDNEKTPRFKQGISFKFDFPINSIEKKRHSSHSLKVYKDIQSDDSKHVPLEDVFVMKFSGEIEAFLVISESILEQVIENKKPDGKYYINCYLKDSDVNEILPNVWLSYEHLKALKDSEYSIFATPKTKLLRFLGTIEV